MLATGALLLAIGLLSLAVLVPLFRRSDAPKWTTWGWVGEVVTVLLVSVLALGITCIVAGAIDAIQSGGHVLDLGVVAVVLVASIIIWRRLSAARRKAAGPAAASVDQTIAGAPHGGQPDELPFVAPPPSPPHRTA